MKKPELIKLVEKFKEKTKSCEIKIKEIENFNLEEKNKKLLNEIEEKSKFINEIYENIDEMQKNIFGDEESEEEGWKEEIEGFYNDLFQDNKEEESYKTQIENILGESKSNSEEIKEIKNKLEDTKVIAKNEKDEDILDEEGEIIYRTKKGLLTTIQEFYKKQNEKYDTLFERIEGLLPGAASAGLSSAYEKNVKDYKESVNIWTKVFIFILTILVIFSGVNFYRIFNVENLQKISSVLLKSIPVSLTLIWMTYFCSKRRSEEKRLGEEYQHKLAMSKTYVGYRREIEKLSKDDKELSLKLLTIMIKAMEYNPSFTLEGKHGDKMPIQEAVEKAIENSKTQLRE